MAQVITLTPVAKNGFANTGVVGIPVVEGIIVIRPATSDEITNFPTAVSAVETRDLQYQQPRKTTYLSATTVAALITATNA